MAGQSLPELLGRGSFDPAICPSARLKHVRDSWADPRRGQTGQLIHPGPRALVQWHLPINRTQGVTS